MKTNKLKALFAAGESAINGWLHIPSMWSAEVMGYAGWDSITIDIQHGMHSMESAIQLVQAISITEAVPIVRVNWNEPGSIMRLLDAGAYGIICPMVNNRADCEAFVGACLYPPQGYRSLGPTRAQLHMGSDYAEHANDEILTIAMVETKEALDNVAEIASVPGLSMIFVGTSDLRLSLLATGTPEETIDAAVDAALDTILAACDAAQILPGLFTMNPERARAMIARGFRFVTCKTDTMLLSEYAQQIVKAVRAGD